MKQEQKHEEILRYWWTSIVKVLGDENS